MEPWAQQPDEPYNHYQWFLAYRALGPGRTLERAYQAMTGKTTQMHGAWTGAAARWAWADRAAAWDVHVLSESTTEVVALFVATLRELAAQTLEALRTHPPQSYAEAMRSLEALASLVPPEAVAAVVAQEPAALGGHPPQEPPTLRLEVGS